ncbi:MAG: putative O-glycosylation ligase, exosortase A system-associated [Spiribacter salinus]|uniref:Putative O-glycosylation ligase, exosortase A system-associated n=1 Tax=Spiribacter salinus TaxID=1335746 RepID=A0A540VQN0_9GAMM|nr:MAG: putative O-glycosylation ligase, exosortase A system-associated [Spiribacter salinus]
MGIRDMLLLTLIGVATLTALGRPWIGVLAWNWVSFMNPHRLSWTLRELPAAQLTAIGTLVGLILTRQRRLPPFRAETVILVCLVLLFTVGTLFAWERSAAVVQLEKVLKIYLFLFVTMMLIYERYRIRMLMLVTIASVGFFGVKGGLFAILTGGNFRIWGPPGSFIADNNAIGLALAMILPLALYAARAESNKYLRWGLYSTFWLTIPAILFTYSRGAFLAIIATLCVIGWQHKKAAAVVGLAMLVGLAASPAILPDAWIERQKTTLTYETDRSAMTRIQAWGVAWNVARESPLVGAGFRFNYAEDERWLSYAPFVESWASSSRAAHSIYFQMLGEHGFLGLGLFLALMSVTFVRLGRLYRTCTGDDDRWIGQYARGAQLALVPYAVAGAFLSLAYFDLFYALVVFSVILDRERAAVVAKVGAPSKAAPVNSV